MPILIFLVEGPGFKIDFWQSYDQSSFRGFLSGRLPSFWVTTRTALAMKAHDSQNNKAFH